MTVAAAKRLSAGLLPALPGAVARPLYDRTALRPGIVHLGIGAFMRAHLAVATDAAITATGDRRWGIVGVSLRQGDTRDALAPQDGLYTVATRDAAGMRLQVVGCVTRLLVAPDDPAAVLEAIAHPDCHVVTLTITEKGYAPDAADTALPPRTAVAFVVHALALRRLRREAPLTLASLDNLPSNGRFLQRRVREVAEALDADLARWIDAHCRFPDSMVDRIVPRTTETDRGTVSAALGTQDAWPVVTEAFFDWTLEDSFAGPRPAWEHGGARVVSDVAPWEKLKLRMLNGAHSQIAYLGQLAGWATVDRAVAEPALRRHLEALWTQEVEPTLPALPGLDLGAYRAALLGRFANPALAHRTAQIAMDGSQKLPQRIVAPLRERLAAGQPAARLALGIAAWLRFVGGRADDGTVLALDDPLAERLRAHVQAADGAPDAAARTLALTRLPEVFGDLAGSALLAAVLAPALDRLARNGALGALESA
jgi:fructuronate reductase